MRKLVDLKYVTSNRDIEHWTILFLYFHELEFFGCLFLKTSLKQVWPFISFPVSLFTCLPSSLFLRQIKQTWCVFIWNSFVTAELLWLIVNCLYLFCCVSFPKLFKRNYKKRKFCHHLLYCMDTKQLPS